MSRIGFKMHLAAAAVAASSFGFAGTAFDDVGFWFRAGYNPVELVNGLSWMLYEFYNAVRVGDPATGSSCVSISGGRRTEAAPDYSTTAGNKLRQEVMDVPMPYAGRTLKSRQVLHFIQPEFTNGDGKTVYATSVIQAANSSEVQGIPVFDNESEKGYSLVMRFKFDGYVLPNETTCNMIGLGYGWSAQKGLQVSLAGSEDNLSLKIWRGSSTTTLTGMQNVKSTRLSRGKWIDLAVTVKGAAGAVYTCAEGGTPWRWSGTLSKPSPSGTPSAYIWIPSAASGNTSGGVAGADGTGAMFRGWVQQVAVWDRELSADEVLNAFCDGRETGEFVRFGVENNSSWEFAGTNKVKKVATTATSADEPTDWRYLPPALNAKVREATVDFDLSESDLGLQPLELRLKTTAASEDGAVSVSLNGKPVCENAQVVPGETLVADIPLAAVRAGKNVLAFRRVDEGAGDIECDCFTVGAKSVNVARGQPVEGDVFADAWGWYRNVYDFAGDGYFRETRVYSESAAPSYDFPDAFHDRPEFRRSAVNAWNAYGPYTNETVEVVDVVCPARGVTLKDQRTIYLRQPSWVDDSGTLVGHCGGIGKTIFGITNAASFAAFARVKIDPNLPNPSPDYSQSIQVMGLGYQWGSPTGKGLAIYLRGTDVQNFYILTYRGGAGLELKATQTGDAKNRLCVGKWIDLGVSVSNGYMRVYTQVEGGTLVEQGPYACSEASKKEPDATSSFYLGVVSGMTYWSPWGGSPMSGGNAAALDAMRGWVHQAAVWPRALTSEEMANAFAWPQPDLVRVGAANGSAAELQGAGSTFAPPADADFDAAPGYISGDAAYAVTFDVPAEEAARNQMIRLVTPPSTDLGAGYLFEFVVNGAVVTNFDRNATATWQFAPKADGSLEVGVRKELLREGENTLEIVRKDANGVLFPIDALSLGNGGKLLRVSKGEGLHLIVQ